MKKQQIVAAILIVTVFSTAIPLCIAEEWLNPPTVTLPNRWALTFEISYPNASSENDPAGAGMVEYSDRDDYDIAQIYYEKAQVSSYTSPQLKSQAVAIFEAIDASLSVNQSGTTEYAGVAAGFAIGSAASNDTQIMLVVFVKDGHYIKVQASYDATTEDRNQVDSLINSIKISVAEAEPEQPFFGSVVFWIIIGVVAAVSVAVVFALGATRKRKSKA